MDSSNELSEIPEVFKVQSLREKGFGPLSEPEEAPQRARSNDFETKSGFSTLISLRSWKRSKSAGPEGFSDKEKCSYEPTIRKLENAPWGFPRLARYNNNESFMIYRRFGEVFSHLLLNKQDEVTELEEELRAIDERDSDDAPEKRSRRLMSRKMGRTRKQVLAELETKALEYGELLIKAQHLAEMRPPSERDSRSVFNYLESDGGQVFPWERQYIKEKEDLITLNPTREYVWLDSMVEGTLFKCRCRVLEYIFCSKDTHKKTGDSIVRYYSRERISRFVTFIITSFVLVLLLIPVWLLWRSLLQGSIANNPDTVTLLVVFTLLFSTGLSMFTSAKRQEILAASAGYFALLLVFLGNGNSLVQVN